MVDRKSILNPLKNWLLSNGKCLGCGKELSKCRKEDKDGITLVICSCRRVFIHDSANGGYNLHRDLPTGIFAKEEESHEDEKFLSGYFY